MLPLRLFVESLISYIETPTQTFKNLTPYLLRGFIRSLEISKETVQGFRFRHSETEIFRKNL